MPGGALMAIEAGALDGVSPDLRPARRPGARRRHGRPARGPAHRCRRPPRRAAHRQGRPHLAAAPDRGPHLRARQAGHRAARRALAPARPPRRGQRGVGDRPGRLGRQRHPGHRPRRRHRADARRGRVGRRRGAGHATPSSRSSSPTASAPTITYVRGVPPVVNEHRSTALLGRAVETVLGRGRPRRHHAEPRRRGLRVVRRQRARRDGPAGHAHAGRTDVRPAPGRPAGRRAGHLRSAPRCWRPRPPLDVDGHRPITLAGAPPVATGRRGRTGSHRVPASRAGEWHPRPRRHLASDEQDRGSSTGGRPRPDRVWQRQRQRRRQRQPVGGRQGRLQGRRAATAPRSAWPTTSAAGRPVVQRLRLRRAEEGHRGRRRHLHRGQGRPDDNDTTRAERLRTLAEGGFNPVIAVGFIYSPAAAKVAAEYPDTNFAVIDGYASTIAEDAAEEPQPT